MKKPVILPVIFLLLAILLLSVPVLAGITFHDKLPIGKAKLYTQDEKGYILELVYLDADQGRARFWVNEKNLTPDFRIDEGYKLEDGSKIENMRILNTTIIDFYFYGADGEGLPVEGPPGAHVQSRMSSFNYSAFYTPEELAAITSELFKSAEETRIKIAPRTAPPPEKEVTFASESHIFDFGWLSALWTWFKTLFS